MAFINIPEFISANITKREKSLFHHDIENKKEALSKEIKGQSVLVIGGAGTIGSNFIKAILPFEPSALTVVDYSENGLTELTRDLRSNKDLCIPHEYITYPFDFGSDVFEKLMASKKFDVIACFAAHKHVRSEKDPLAIEAMINNNVFNTEKLLKLSIPHQPRHFFAVSTDKAANPVNVMGASKKMMEKVLMAYTKDLNIATARFANVAFSNGSLLFGFIERIMKRQPLSAPSDVRRYFVSPKESGELCMLACFLGETGDIFFPKLGEDQMMTFSEIAESLIQSIGLECDYCESESDAKTKAKNWIIDNPKYPVYFFKSDTSGEKMYEEFFDEKDKLDIDSFKELGIIKLEQKENLETIDLLIEEFKSLFEKDIQKSEIIDLLNHFIPDFSHIETGKSLDQKM